METSLKDRNYRSEIQVKSVTSTHQTKVPYEGHIPAAYFPAQDKVLFPICLSLSSNCQHCKAIQLWVKQLYDTLPSTSSTKLSVQFFFITRTDEIECQGLRDDLCPLTVCFSGSSSCVCAHSAKSVSLLPHGLQPARLLCPQISQARTAVGCHFLLPRIFLTQGSNACLLRLLHGQAGSLPANFSFPLYSFNLFFSAFFFC